MSKDNNQNMGDKGKFMMKNMTKAAIIGKYEKIYSLMTKLNNSCLEYSKINCELITERDQLNKRLTEEHSQTQNLHTKVRKLKSKIMISRMSHACNVEDMMEKYANPIIWDDEEDAILYEKEKMK